MQPRFQGSQLIQQRTADCGSLLPKILTHAAETRNLCQLNHHQTSVCTIDEQINAVCVPVFFN